MAPSDPAAGGYDADHALTRVNDATKLGRLMAAVLMIAADIELADLLAHLVEEARDLVDARYGALGVLNQTRTGLEQS